MRAALAALLILILVDCFFDTIAVLGSPQVEQLPFNCQGTDYC
jgi:hypothetical protein